MPTVRLHLGASESLSKALPQRWAASLSPVLAVREAWGNLEKAAAMNQCQGKVKGWDWEGRPKDFPCYAVNASIRENGEVWCNWHYPTAIAERAANQRLHDASRFLLEACREAHVHVLELREAWERGVLNESDTLGSTRSNRNAAVEAALRYAIAKAEGKKP